MRNKIIFSISVLGIVAGLMAGLLDIFLSLNLAEDAPDKIQVVQTVPTLRGARTLLLTPATRRARLQKILALTRHVELAG